MDDVPRESQPHSISTGLTNRQAANPDLDGVGQDQDGVGQDQEGETADDPYSPGPEALPLLLGSLIALMTAVVPLTMVVTGRSLPHSPSSFEGSAPSAGLPGAWAVEPGGGNPGRQRP
jgi:hypothetical protein